MVVYAGQGDPRRSMSLLWRGAAEAKPGLTLESILDAAVAVADEGGMASLSMRAVGERLGRTAMALYGYVPGKAELVDLMYDRVLAELPTSYDLSVGWRAALTAWAQDSRAFHLRHPWVLVVSQARPVLGPHEFVVLETVLSVLRETGLPPSVLRGVVGTVVQFVRGAAAVIADAREAAGATGVADDEWWYARSALITELAPDFAQRFPLTTWFGEEEPPPVPGEEDAPYLERDAVRNFRVGLEVLLDGIEAAVSRVVSG
ncbi:TetR/AcrR family transcriptional regulator [Actinosynnema sp. NPDC020468]|uniref:TetR/AcrR family transcriptional regulator n=1 Tax=Actinosynnema sp. NPDC020468 TaxID=3154488 RepID=UPI0033D9FA68